MSSIFFRRESERLVHLEWVLAAGILLSTSVAGAVLRQPTIVRKSEFINWPSGLASRAPDLAAGITRDFGEHPLKLTFGRRDALEVLFWNPAFLRHGAQTKELPYQLLPDISVAAKQVADFVWSSFGRDAGVDTILVHFVRARTIDYVIMTREVPAQDVFVTFTRQWLESAPHWGPAVAISQLEGGDWSTADSRACERILNPAIAKQLSKWELRREKPPCPTPH